MQKMKTPLQVLINVFKSVEVTNENKKRSQSGVMEYVMVIIQMITDRTVLRIYIICGADKREILV